jgi:hypothetical protein
MDDNLEEWIHVYGPSKEVETRLRSEWARLDPYDKLLADYYLTRLDANLTRAEYVLEGLFWFLGPWLATHLMHIVDRKLVFPIDADQRYFRLRAILRAIGIQYVDDEQLPPVEVILAVSDGVRHFAETNKLEPWQMWALVYDLGPRLIGTPPSYAVESPSKVWVTAAGPDNFEEVDNHGSSDEDTWSTNRKVRRGDVLLMYCLRPRSSIVALYRCAVDAYRDPLHPAWSGVFTEITDKLSIPPISLREMQNDPVLKNWSLVKTHFTGVLHHSVPDEIWIRLKELIATKDPEKGRMIQEYASAVDGLRSIRGIVDQRSEKEFEDELVLPLLERLGWAVGLDLQRQFEMPIKVGSGKPILARADFVGFASALSGIAVMVVETKRRIVSEGELTLAVQQCESYAGKLRCTRFAVAAPQGVWVYQLNFPGQSSLLTRSPIDLSEASKAERLLRPLLGRSVLMSSVVSSV